MGSRSILAVQYMSPIFLEHFDESCLKFRRRRANLANYGNKDRESKKLLQKRTAIALEVEDFLKNSRILDVKWISSNGARLILSTGIVLLLFIEENYEGNELSFTVHRIPGFDGICPPLAVAWEKDTGVLLTSDGRIVLFKSDLLASPESTVDLQCQFETFPSFLPPYNSKRVERRILLNPTANELAIWWPTSGDEVFPWNPKPEQNANVLVYSLAKLDEDRPSLIFHTRTEGNLLSVHFLPHRSEIITVEDSCAVESTRVAALRETKYDLISQLRVSEVVIPLQNQLKCHAYDRRKEKLCLGLCNSCIVISFHDGKITRFTKTTFMPCQLAWHENGLAVLALGSMGQVMMFDIALNPLFFRDSDDRRVPSLIFQLEPHVAFRHVSWGSCDFNDTNSFILLIAETGNISVLDLQSGSVTLTSLISRHLDSYPCGYAEAIKVLNGVPWDSDLCATAHYLIFSRLRVEEYSEVIEGYFEKLLETYFNPLIDPLEIIWASHKDIINSRALSYHHWLFLAGRFKRSLEIAAMIKDEGCIRKVYHGALCGGASDVAAEAEIILREMQSVKKIGHVREARTKNSSGSSTSSTRNSSCSTCDSSQSGGEECEDGRHFVNPSITSGFQALDCQDRNENTVESNASLLSPSNHPQEKWEQLVSSGPLNPLGSTENLGSRGNGLTVVPLGNV